MSPPNFFNGNELCKIEVETADSTKVEITFRIFSSKSSHARKFGSMDEEGLEKQVERKLSESGSCRREFP